MRGAGVRWCRVGIGRGRLQREAQATPAHQQQPKQHREKGKLNEQNEGGPSWSTRRHRKCNDGWMGQRVIRVASHSNSPTGRHDQNEANPYHHNRRNDLEQELPHGGGECAGVTDRTLHPRVSLHSPHVRSAGLSLSRQPESHGPDRDVGARCRAAGVCVPAQREIRVVANKCRSKKCERRDAP